VNLFDCHIWGRSLTAQIKINPPSLSIPQPLLLRGCSAKASPAESVAISYINGKFKLCIRALGCSATASPAESVTMSCLG